MRFIMDVDLEAEPSTPEGDRMLRDMIEMIEMTLVEDFGRGAWGGYEGPFIETVRISREESNGL